MGLFQIKTFYRQITMVKKTADRHHILFARSIWSIKPEGRFIRQTPSLIPWLDIEAHQELHANTPEVPLLGYSALCLLSKEMRRWQNCDDTFRTINFLKRTIDEVAYTKSRHPIEKDLAGLTVAAIEAQEPYLRAGLILRDNVKIQ